VAFVMAEGHLCVKNAAIRDAEVAFGHDKSFKNDTFHFYEKALVEGMSYTVERQVLSLCN
jgi:hypothetical protein